MEKSNPQKIYAILDELGIEYAKTVHEPAFTMEDLGEISQSLGAPFCKNLFLTNRQKTEFFLLLIDENKRFKTSEVSKKLGMARLSFGSEEAMIEYLGTQSGALSPLGVVFDEECKINVIVDKSLLMCDKICVHPCVNTQSLVMKRDDLLEKYLIHFNHKPIFIEIEGED